MRWIAWSRAATRRIAAVRPSHNLNFGYLFLAGYRKALKRHGIDFDPDLIGSRSSSTSPAATR